MHPATISPARYPARNELFVPLTILAHPGAGRAAIATAPIAAGCRVVRFGGRTVGYDELATLPDDFQARSIQIDWDAFLVSPPEVDPADCINHSCDPNCGLVDEVTVVARRDITAGERITFEYATSDSCDYSTFVCSCGAPGCRRLVSAGDWADPAIVAAHRDWYSPYLRPHLPTVPSRSLSLASAGASTPKRNPQHDHHLSAHPALAHRRVARGARRLPAARPTGTRHRVRDLSG